ELLPGRNGRGVSLGRRGNRARLGGQHAPQTYVWQTAKSNRYPVQRVSDSTLRACRNCRKQDRRARPPILQPGEFAPRGRELSRTSDVSHKWLALCRKGFWPPARRERRAYPSWVCKEQATTREAKRTAARRVAPKMAWGFVVPQSRIPADMLLRHASPQAILGAT